MRDKNNVPGHKGMEDRLLYLWELILEAIQASYRLADGFVHIVCLHVLYYYGQRICVPLDETYAKIG